MKGLSSKTERFSLLPQASGAVIGQFAVNATKSLAELVSEEDLRDYEIRVIVEVVRKDDSRVGDTTYRRLLRKRIVENGTSAWYNGEGQYLFDFKEGKFMWGNRDLYLSPAQQYDLYGCLLLGEGMERHMIAALKGKFGKDFLKGHI